MNLCERLFLFHKSNSECLFAGYFLSVDPSGRSSLGFSARLISALQAPADQEQCLSFWYRMDGPQIGKMTPARLRQSSAQEEPACPVQSSSCLPFRDSKPEGEVQWGTRTYPVDQNREPWCCVAPGTLQHSPPACSELSGEHFLPC